MYKIVFFDLDGTLLNREKQVPQEVKQAIRSLRRQGTIVMIATGRAPYFFTEVRRELEIDSYVSINGAYVVHEGRVISETRIPQTLVEEFTTFAADMQHPMVYLTEQKHVTAQPDHPLVVKDFTELRVGLPSYASEPHRRFPVYQMIAHFPEAYDDLYRQRFPELTILRWSDTAVDAIPRGLSKAQGIATTLRLLGIPREQAAAFGDGPNDLEMLQYVGMGVAMGNASKELQRHADFVTRDVEEGGVVYGLRHLQLIP
ncbi:phosphatase [Alicyclobacillus contaminans]|uniref:Cof-type HAD-IIB family hydrolase n=1 Tax=Alicyclobacillus contaminans TaxID=392016 RepID=UPI0003F7A884|nr:Cof-type HAD-IIB family hydrolase [Alicyclobacillus contaminans]GMA49990.1 phosphatase [Alicyclobacillus contaminans]